MRRAEGVSGSDNRDYPRSPLLASGGGAPGSPLLRAGREALRLVPALFVALVWGTTFLASKRVLCAGVEPATLMCVRFAVAYAVLWVLHPRAELRLGWRAELKFLLLGVCGGSLYFLCEYEALLHTSSVNVGVITSTVPLVTTAMLLLLRRVRVGRCYWLGGVVAFAGVLLLVLGPVVLSRGLSAVVSHPLGDLLALLDTLLWACYTVVLARCGAWHPLLVSRRLFFYALVTIAPFAVSGLGAGQLSLLARPGVWQPALYLALVASGACLVLWQVSVNMLGPVRTNNYLYLLTVVPVVASALLCREELGLCAVVGAALVLAGIVVGDRGVKRAVRV